MNLPPRKRVARARRRRGFPAAFLGHLRVASGVVRPGYASNVQLLEQVAIDPSLDRASIHLKASRGLLVAAGLGVHERTVTPQEVINRQESLGDAACRGVAKRCYRSLWWGVSATNKDVAHTLLEFAEVAEAGAGRRQPAVAGSTESEQVSQADRRVVPALPCRWAHWSGSSIALSWLLLVL